MKCTPDENGKYSFERFATRVNDAEERWYVHAPWTIKVGSLKSISFTGDQISVYTSEF